MIRIEAKSESQDAVTLLLGGKMSGSALGELRREIDHALSQRKRVVIDLGEITLVDKQSVEFLAQQATERVEFINCPPYIQPWIAQAGK